MFFLQPKIIILRSSFHTKVCTYFLEKKKSTETQKYEYILHVYVFITCLTITLIRQTK